MKTHLVAIWHCDSFGDALDGFCSPAVVHIKNCTGVFKVKLK